MTQQVLTQVSRIKYPWLIGQRQDLLFFIAPTIIAFVAYGFIAVFPSLSAATIAFTLLYAVNVVHQASTYFHFADQRNRKYYFGTPKQCFKFIVLPIALLAASIALGFVYFQLVILAWFIWGIPHVVQQNTRDTVAVSQSPFRRSDRTQRAGNFDATSFNVILCSRGRLPRMASCL
jgi:hypothetical protein